MSTSNTSIVRIGLDDTDHPEFGCTTHSFHDLLSNLTAIPSVIVLERMLVRLWPYASRRTRGNGALSATLEIPSESKIQFIDSCAEWFDSLLSEISHYPEISNSATPALLISFDKAPSKWYWEAVRGEVNLVDRESEIRSSGVTIFSHPDNWGMVGASAAISWEPGINHSWELIAWREDSKIGSRRAVSKDSVFEMSELFPETFLNRDPTADKGIIAPRTPCPVLYGIRGSSKDAVESANSWLQDKNSTEKCLDWASHKTNQLSDDHLPGPMSGTVITSPEVLKGAHASLKVISGGKGETLVAFSEGGPVNKLLRQLSPGDRISWMGLISPDRSIHLERLRIESASPRISSRPRCCGKSMRSKGRNQPLFCLRCGNKESKIWLSDNWSPVGVPSIDGWVQPPPSQRRHLSMPLEHGIPA